MLSFDFVQAGTVVQPELGKVYVDVGNAFYPGVLDHHHPDAPDACTAMLVLNHPDYVICQIVDDQLTIIPHQYPDLDAVTGAYFAAMHAQGLPAKPMHQDWAQYVCRVDQGHTTLNPECPVTPYSVFMMRIHLLHPELSQDSVEVSQRMLDAGFNFLDELFDWMESGGQLGEPAAFASLNTFEPERAALQQDLHAYQRDIQRAETLSCTLPRKDGLGRESVVGLWLQKPESALFKSWARGDAKAAGNGQGFVFLSIQLSDSRFILSVDPASDVYLKGLGDALEKMETHKRKTLGMERQGDNRPGYDSPDPWYDGRSPLHNYTIIDAPRAGTVQEWLEVREIFSTWVKED